MLKRRDVVLAETIENKKAILANLNGAIECMGLTTPYEDTFEVPSGTQKHLMPVFCNVHILGGSEDKIEVGDWVYNRISTYKHTGSHVYQILDKSMLWTSGTQKIIATSDAELYSGIGKIKQQIPQLPIGFIRKYAKMYCKEQVITEALVEYDEYATVKPETDWIYKGLRLKVNSVYIERNAYDPTAGRNLRLSLLGTKFEGKHIGNDTVIWERDLIMDYQIKVDPKDNTITLKKYKGLWNKDEHAASIWAFAKEFVANTDTAYKKAEIDKWIAENL